MKGQAYFDIALKYAKDVVAGKIRKGNNLRECRRFLNDLKDKRFEVRTKDADFVCGFIEQFCVHQKGEAMDGTSLKNKPMKLQPWQVFIVVNLLSFYLKGTEERRFKEAFIFVPRKSGKSKFVADLSLALAFLQRRSGSTVYITAASLKQSAETFSKMLYNLTYRLGKKKAFKEFRIIDNKQAHSIEKDFEDERGKTVGSLYIEAMAANPDNQDSFGCNICIADEIHAYKSPAQYNRFKEAMKAYTNKLMIGITTAGDNMNSFCYRKLKNCEKILDGTVKDESYFVFISKAEQDADGNVDFLNPLQHELANPSYGVTIRPADMMNDALQAQNDPQQRKDFLSRSLNIYTTSMKSYFNIVKFQSSDAKYNWTLEELAKLPIEWYGGADLSKMHDLTAAALFGYYEEKKVAIVITHGFFPVVAAAEKADKDAIPLFGWKDDGVLTMTNTPTTEVDDVVKWFIEMRKKGFKIKQVGHDRKFAREYVIQMKKAGFNVIDQPQYYHVKSEGFRYIEKAMIDKRLYYLHNEAFEYCVQNVRAIEKSDDMIQFEKVMPELRIDYFDAAIFAIVRYLNSLTDGKDLLNSWFTGGKKK